MRPLNIGTIAQAIYRLHADIYGLPKGSREAAASAEELRTCWKQLDSAVAPEKRSNGFVGTRLLGESPKLSLDLADGSVFSTDLTTGNIQLVAANEKTKQLWSQAVRGGHTGGHAGGDVGAVGRKAYLPKSFEEFTDDPLVAEARVPKKLLSPDFNGELVRFPAMLLGHPLRPLLVGLVGPNEKTAADSEEFRPKGNWKLYYYSFDRVLWMRDSADERFNQAAIDTLDEFSDKLDDCEVGGVVYPCFHLKFTYKTGMHEDARNLLDALFEAEANIDDSETFERIDDGLNALPDDKELNRQAAMLDQE